MTNFKQIKERYLKEPFGMKLGHLASDLARIAGFLDNSMNIRAVEDLLEESKFFIDWAAPDAPPHVQALLWEIKAKLALWQENLGRQKQIPGDIEEVKKNTKTWSEKLLQASGLLTA